jgi:hypothetical protein
MQGTELEKMTMEKRKCFGNQKKFSEGHSICTNCPDFIDCKSRMHRPEDIEFDTRRKLEVEMRRLESDITDFKDETFEKLEELKGRVEEMNMLFKRITIGNGHK